MLHRTLTPPFLHFSSFRPLSVPPHSPPSLPPYLSSAQAEREARMEGVEVTALKKACLPEAPPSAPWQGQENQGFVLPDDVAWAVERGGFLGEEFSVDDLLDFDGLEPDKESEKEEEDKGVAFEAVNHKNDTSTSSASSAVSFEDPPLSDINLPTHDAAEFEWMSSIIDDSLLEYPPSAGVPPPYRPATHSDPQPKTQVSPPGENLCIISTEALVPVKAKRSKRPRVAGSAWPTAGATALSDSSASSTTTTTTSSSSCSSSPSYSSYLVTNHVSFLFDANPPQPKKQNPKKRGRKPKSHHEQNHHHPPPHAAAAGIGGMHCTHCGAQKTPQWRTGPLGPKTLCNACGVRYKSGRLMPEYRPAASPTFVSHVHSNSHRKVLEMRRKKEEHFISAAAPPVSSF